MESLKNRRFGNLLMNSEHVSRFSSSGAAQFLAAQAPIHFMPAMAWSSMVRLIVIEVPEDVQHLHVESMNQPALSSLLDGMLASPADNPSPNRSDDV